MFCRSRGVTIVFLFAASSVNGSMSGVLPVQKIDELREDDVGYWRL